MPTVRLIREGAPELLPMEGRSPGIHVSTLIHELCITLGHYKDTGPVNAEGRARMELGNALEHAIIQRFALDQPKRFMQLGELMLDDIYGTPDLYDFVDRCDCEIKLTWMSAKWGPGSQKFWKYEVQLKAYCRMMKLSKGRLHVGFVNGNYRRGNGGGPMYRIWEYDFTQRELQDNWDMLKRQADRPRIENLYKITGPVRTVSNEAVGVVGGGR